MDDRHASSNTSVRKRDQRKTSRRQATDHQKSLLDALGRTTYRSLNHEERQQLQIDTGMSERRILDYLQNKKARSKRKDAAQQVPLQSTSMLQSSRSTASLTVEGEGGAGGGNSPAASDFSSDYTASVSSNNIPPSYNVSWPGPSSATHYPHASSSTTPYTVPHAFPPPSQQGGLPAAWEAQTHNQNDGVSEGVDGLPVMAQEFAHPYGWAQPWSPSFAPDSIGVSTAASVSQPSYDYALPTGYPATNFHPAHTPYHPHHQSPPAPTPQAGHPSFYTPPADFIAVSRPDSTHPPRLSAPVSATPGTQYAYYPSRAYRPPTSHVVSSERIVGHPAYPHPAASAARMSEPSSRVSRSLSESLPDPTSTSLQPPYDVAHRQSHGNTPRQGEDAYEHSFRED